MRTPPERAGDRPADGGIRTADGPALPTALFDPARLAAVRRTGLLDTGPEEPFDRLSRLAATMLGTPFVLVTIVDETRSF
ncbi:hypothetical protein [Micromonospora sp. LOL_024]|uniref:hypothetical protein n=1 Tax=Micromonospora sp. LOL_024 TaxID=3345412 RepID=UPI003A83CAE4